MKIIIPISGFGRAGGYRVLSKLANEWTKSGHLVTFLVNEHSELPYFPTIADIVWINNNGQEVGQGSNYELTKLPQGKVQVFNNFKSLIKGINKYGIDADIILANHSLTVWPIYLAKSNAKKVYYVQAYEPEMYAEMKSLISRILQLVSATSYLLPFDRIVNSPIYCNYKLLRAVKMIPPGLDLSIYFPVSKKAENDNVIILGCIGRLEPNKGTALVLESYEKMLALGMKVKLRIAYGNIPKDCKLSPDTYEIVVPKNDIELAEFYRSLNIMLAPCYIQIGAPHYPVMEAMACGIPVVSTGHMPANNENAWIVKPKSADAIVSAVQEILLNKDKCNKKVENALSSIQAFSWEKIAVNMLRVMSEDAYISR